MIMALKQTAEARRRRFLKLKKQHGDIEQMTKAFHTQKNTVWFDEEGDIKSCSKEPNTKFDKKYKSAQMTKLLFLKMQIGPCIESELTIK